MSKEILIAGIGNIFHGDDAFGSHVLRYLDCAERPAGADLRDFGIRCYDLAFAILEGYPAVILVDAVSRGEHPGTLFLLELDADRQDAMPARMDGHSIDLPTVLQLVRMYGGQIPRLFLVGCEPASLDCEDGDFGLSAEIANAVPSAAELVRSAIRDLRNAGMESSLHSLQSVNLKGQDYALLE